MGRPGPLPAADRRRFAATTAPCTTSAPRTPLRAATGRCSWTSGCRTRDEPAPLVVWIHGGGWMMGDRRYLPETLRPNQVFDELLAAGLAVATIDYRHALEAAFPAQLNDAKAAIRWLRAHADDLGISTTRIGVMGESAGGHLAALVGLTAHRADLEGTHGVVGPSSAVDVVVDWYGPADFTTMPRMTPPPHIAAKLEPAMLTPPEDQLTRGLDGAGPRRRQPDHPRDAGGPAVPPRARHDRLAGALRAERAAARGADRGRRAVRLVPGRGRRAHLHGLRRHRRRRPAVRRLPRHDTEGDAR